MAEIVMIPIESLNAHPDNPRRHVGDVTELADSIKANGILQNLTVVPYEKDGESVPGQYTVVIGHRRMAAARLAGLDALPCIIANMSYKEQISTMLTENMQRSDLTIYEQAQSFQLMLDMGDSIAEVADKSGFSETTIRRRVKLLELDHGKLERAEKRGGTLSDYIELEKIQDPERKNRVLDTIGTPDFKNRLAIELSSEKAEKLMAEWLEKVRTFAKELKVVDYRKHKVVQSYSIYNQSKELEIPADAETVKYYYTVERYGIRIYTDKENQTEAEWECEKKAAELKARQEQIRHRKEEIKEISARHYELRIEFAQELAIKPEQTADIMRCAAERMWDSGEESDDRVMADLCALDFAKNTEDDIFAAAVSEKPEKALLYMVIASLDDRTAGYYREVWNSDVQTYKAEYKQNKKLNVLYELLCKLGYEMSGEELEMQSGKHKIFKAEGEA